MTLAQRTLLSALAQRGLSAETLDRAVDTAERTSRTLSTVLVDDQIVTEFELASALAEAYGIEAIDLTTFSVDPSVMTSLPLGLARRHQMLPIAVNSTTVTVALLDPGNVLALDDIRAATGKIVRP